MIELYEGVPGSGKSYHAVKQWLLPYVRSNRKIYIYVDGIYLDKLAHFEDRTLDDLKQQVVPWTTPEQVRAMPDLVEHGSVVIIDEAQTIFRSMERVDKHLARWLETHRHYGVDVLMLCQSFKQLSQTVTRLVESTSHFRKLSFVGLPTKYQERIRGNPEDIEIIRKKVHTYSSQIWAYYRSYANAAVVEQRRVASALRSVTVLTGAVAAGFALVVMIWHPWSSLGATTGTPQKLLPAGPLASDKKPGPGPVNNVPAPDTQTLSAPRVCVIGAIAFIEGTADERTWRYMLDDGNVLTAAEITGKYGVSVLERMRGRVMVLEGPGVGCHGPSGN